MNFKNVVIVKKVVFDRNMSDEIKLFDELSESYKASTNGVNALKALVLSGPVSNLSLLISIACLVTFFIALLLEDRPASIISLLILVISLLVFEISVFVQLVVQTFLIDRKNWLMSGFRKNLQDQEKRVALIKRYPQRTRYNLAACLRLNVETENSRLNLLIGASRKLGIIPAVAAVYAAYVSVFPENAMIAISGESDPMDQLVTRLKILFMAVIVGVYIGACAAESAVVRAKSMIQCLDLACNVVEGET